MGCMEVWVSSVANIKLLFIQLLLSDVTIKRDPCCHNNRMSTLSLSSCLRVGYMLKL